MKVNQVACFKRVLPHAYVKFDLVAEVIVLLHLIPNKKLNDLSSGALMIIAVAQW